jgi:uncharacterized membrane protein YdjX (TVP38/TMEM64 family)
VQLLLNLRDIKKEAAGCGGARPMDVITFVAGIGSVYICAVIVDIFRGPLEGIVTRLILEAGYFGHVILLIMYILSGLPFVLGPFSAIAYTFSCGLGSFLYGWTALIESEIFTVITLACAYRFNRRYLSAMTKRRLSDNWMWEVTEIVLQDFGSFTLQVFLRVSPLPFFVQNSLFSLSGVPFQTYIAASTIGCQYDIIIMWLIGTSVRNAAKGDESRGLSFNNPYFVLSLYTVTLLFCFVYCNYFMIHKLPGMLDPEGILENGDASKLGPRTQLGLAEQSRTDELFLAENGSPPDSPTRNAEGFDLQMIK